MDCVCRSPINCYNDKTRYKTMVIFNVFDLIFFIIRLSLASNDISKDVSDTMNFLIPILLFDLIGSVPLIICNIIYVIARHCIQPLLGRNNSFPRLWHLGTMTCIRSNFNTEYPQSILLIRILFIICSFILKFICFVLGASCSARFKPRCTAYAVIAAFGLIPSFIVIVTEFVHFFRLWTYNPTDTRNNNRNAVIVGNDPRQLLKTHRNHLGFIDRSLLNDGNAERFRQERCENALNCKSSKLRHYLLYHTLEPEHDVDFDALSDNEKESFIAFYQTSKDEALDIAENGFPYGDNSDRVHREYLRLDQNIFFTRSCRTDSHQSYEAVICVRLNLGRVETVDNCTIDELNHYFARNDGLCDTVYIKSKRRIHLRMPAQIEKWVISINGNIDRDFYGPCI